MKKISSLIVLILCVVFSVLTLTSCAKTYAPTDVQYTINHYGFETDIRYLFTLNNLPKGSVKLNYTVKFKDDKGNSLYDKTVTKSVTVNKDETQITISDTMYIFDNELANHSLINQLSVSNVEVTNTMSNEENRLKPYSIAISVLASAGTIVMIVLFVVGACSKKHKQNSEQPQTDKRELDN